MGVYISGMEMPKTCEDCPCAHIFDSFTCMVAKRSFDKYPLENREDWCPLVPVPPHGRLGDLDELHNHLNEWYLTHEHGFSETEKIYIRAMLSGVKDSPTVIPASEEDKS